MLASAYKQGPLLFGPEHWVGKDAAGRRRDHRPHNPGITTELEQAGNRSLWHKVESPRKVWVASTYLNSVQNDHLNRWRL